MSGKYRAYPEYKDAGVEWLNEIPEHWNSTPLKYVTDFINGCAFKPTDWKVSGTPIIRIENLNGSENFNHFQGDVDERYIVEQGDLLFGWSGNKGTSFGPFLWWKEGVCYLNQHIFRLDDFKCNKQWFYWVLKAVTYYVEEQTQGIIGMVHVTKGNLGSIKVPVLDEDERTAIANFLDHETAKIETLIEEQQSLIRLLKEKRQAVISHAVTKGLNPDAPMKDSGVEWFAEFPEHWKLGKLGYYAKISNGATPSRENINFWENGNIGWLNSAKVNDVFITEANQFITSLAVSQTSVQKVKKHDLVIAITGEGQTRGRVAVCMIDATINQHLAAVSIRKPDIDYAFLFHYLVSQYERIRYESAGAGSTKGAITCGDIISYPIPIPPPKEQETIVRHIEQQTSKFDALIGLANEQVHFAAERRTALISAAVTGKIDLRHWQPTAHSQQKQTEAML